MASEPAAAAATTGRSRHQTGSGSSSGSGSTAARSRQHLLAFVVEFTPYGVGRFSHPGLLHQFARHRAHQVFVGVERLQTFARELALHHERHQHLLAHQTEAGLLHRARVSDELHPHRESLPDAPRSSTRLAQGMQRVSGLVEIERRKRQQVQSRLDQLGMADHHLDARPSTAGRTSPLVYRWRRMSAGPRRECPPAAAPSPTAT